MPKRSIRQEVLARRKALSAEDCRLASSQVQQFFLASMQYQQASCIIIYAPIHNEVATQMIVHHALGTGKQVGFPVVVGQTMVFRGIQADAAMQRGAFGILEPCSGGELLLPDQADIIVVPGVAFDEQGHRIGYGKGYYDKTIHHVEGQGKLVGFCYEFQVVESIAGQSHDVKMDCVITEKRIITPNAKQISAS
jgi:5-formyltetrahydrofolate cyclo-ligase